MLKHNNSDCPFKARAQAQCRDDIISILDPAYRPASYAQSSPIIASTSSGKTYRDAWGNVHDPSYQYFPTEEWRHHRQAHRSSFESDRRPSITSTFVDDDEETEDEDDEINYAFGGSKSRSRVVKKTYPSSTSTSAQSSPVSYTSRLPPAPRSVTLSLPEEEASKRPSHRPFQAAHRKLSKGSSRRHDWHDEDADDVWGANEEELTIEKRPYYEQPSPSEGDQDDEEESGSPLRVSPVRKHWQYAQLSVKLALFRAERRIKKHASA